MVHSSAAYHREMVRVFVGSPLLSLPESDLWGVPVLCLTRRQVAEVVAALHISCVPERVHVDIEVEQEMAEILHHSHHIIMFCSSDRSNFSMAAPLRVASMKTRRTNKYELCRGGLRMPESEGR